LYFTDCARNIDLVFMLDRSGSVGQDNHNLALEFMKTAVSRFTIGSANTRVGVVPYSNSASVQFDLNRHTSLQSLQEAISNIRFTGGATNTPDALNDARTLLDPSENRGARPNSQGIPKLAILITGEFGLLIMNTYRRQCIKVDDGLNIALVYIILSTSKGVSPSSKKKAEVKCSCWKQLNKRLEHYICLCYSF